MQSFLFPPVSSQYTPSSMTKSAGLGKILTKSFVEANTKGFLDPIGSTVRGVARVLPFGQRAKRLARVGDDGVEAFAKKWEHNPNSLRVGDLMYDAGEAISRSRHTKDIDDYLKTISEGSAFSLNGLKRNAVRLARRASIPGLAATSTLVPSLYGTASAGLGLTWASLGKAVESEPMMRSGVNLINRGMQTRATEVPEWADNAALAYWTTRGPLWARALMLAPRAGQYVWDWGKGEVNNYVADRIDKDVIGKVRAGGTAAVDSILENRWRVAAGLAFNPDKVRNEALSTMNNKLIEAQLINTPAGTEPWKNVVRQLQMRKSDELDQVIGGLRALNNSQPKAYAELQQTSDPAGVLLRFPDVVKSLGMSPEALKSLGPVATYLMQHPEVWDYIERGDRNAAIELWNQRKAEAARYAQR